MTTPFARIWRLAIGDRRDQREVIRGAGFVDEQAAARWAAGLFGPDENTEAERIRRIRQERPDMGLATARFIVRQYQARHL